MLLIDAPDCCVNVGTGDGREELGDRMGVTSTSSTSSFALPLTPFLTKKMEPEITGRGSGSLGG